MISFVVGNATQVVSAIKQACIVDIYEFGTTAAVTTFSTTRGDPPTIVFNKPHLYLLLDKSNNIIFMGQYVK